MLLPMLCIYQEYVRNHHYSLQVRLANYLENIYINGRNRHTLYKVSVKINMLVSVCLVSQSVINEGFVQNKFRPS